jgi:hypothetical protein
VFGEGFGHVADTAFGRSPAHAANPLHYRWVHLNNHALKAVDAKAGGIAARTGRLAQDHASNVAGRCLTHCRCIEQKGLSMKKMMMPKIAFLLAALALASAGLTTTDAFARGGGGGGGFGGGGGHFGGGGFGGGGGHFGGGGFGGGGGHFGGGGFGGGGGHFGGFGGHFGGGGYAIRPFRMGGFGGYGHFGGYGRGDFNHGFHGRFGRHRNGLFLGVPFGFGDAYGYCWPPGYYQPWGGPYACY